MLYSAPSKGVLYPTSQSRCRSTAPLKRGALGKEVSFRSNTRCCDKTSPPQSLPLSGEVARRRRDGEVWPAPPAKASPVRGGGIERSEDVGEVVQSSTCVIPLTRKASFVQPLRRLRRQLPWQGSPWQRGVVFDETDLRLLENVTECQSLSLWERWHGEAVTERARMLTKSKKHSDTSPVCQRHRIAVLSCFILPGLPSQALARQLSQRESPWQGGQALVYASMPWSAGG